MINNPGINDTLAVLETLKGVLADFARREERINHEFRTKSQAANHAHDARVQALEQQLADYGAQAELDEARARAGHLARCQALTNRIHAIQADLKERLAGGFEALDAQLGNDVRQQTALAEENRAQALARELAEHEAFQHQLAAAGETLRQLTRSVQKAFRGYRLFRRMLPAGRSGPAPDPARNEHALYEDFQRLAAGLPGELARFGKQPAPRLFGMLPLWLATVLLGGAAGAPAALQHFHHDTALPPATTAVSLGALVLLWIFYGYGRQAARPAAAVIAGHLVAARQSLSAAVEKAGAHHLAEQARLRQECEEAIRNLNQNWREQVRDLAALRADQPRAVEEKARRVLKRCEEFKHLGRDRIKRRFSDDIARRRQETADQVRQLTGTHQAGIAELKERHQANWRALLAAWQAATEPLHTFLRAVTERADQLFPPWDLARWENWHPPAQFTNAAQVGRLQIPLADFAEALPKDPRLTFPGAPLPEPPAALGVRPSSGAATPAGLSTQAGNLNHPPATIPAAGSEVQSANSSGKSLPASLSVPFLLTYPQQGSILFQTGPSGTTEAVDTINNLIFRLISTTPPGKLSVTIFDPVGLGENFAALMHLADYEESAINSRIWTQTTQFEEKLSELNEHMEKVIQMYLRNDYATIAEYNAEAGTMAEKYHFLVIASFPVNFSETAARRLRNIAASGARCGVYVFLQWDQRTPLPADIRMDDLQKTFVCLAHGAGGFRFTHQPLHGVQITLDPPPSPEFATRFLNQSGRHSKNSTRVEVPFEQVAPAADTLWRESTVDELRVPIGRSGATKLQYLAIGKGTRQHALVAGKTGSGKSTLFHVIITSLALWCGPDQVEFYLVDFKKGVEFKCYATRRLPHARVVAIESDRAFGLSVLQRVDEELRRRGDLFRQHGAQDLAGYYRGGGVEPLPRSLLLIDEFQEFFVEEDRISQGAAVLLDRIIRQGRAFGIHVVLGSQTLGGAYTLARATIGQMVIRIALQCNEADAYLIMDQDNPAPRLLSRPGEGIYNDTAGSIEGNSPFQCVWLDDQVRDRHLALVRAHADQSPGRYPGPIIFEGSAPADVRENLLLAGVLAALPAALPGQPRVWLGAPNSIKGPTEVVFKRQSGNHLLIVSQSEERTLTMLSLALLTLAAQYPRRQTRFVVLDSTPPGFPQREFFQRLLAAVPHEVVQVNNANLAEVMAGLAADLKARGAESAGPGPETFLLIQGLQNFKKLRAEDEFSYGGGDAGSAPNPAQVLLDLITEGPARGFHLLTSVDTYNNVNRCLGRKALSEFEMRVLFQMSAGDSASLIDSPDAGNLGFHRALLYLDREGVTETFRPYAQPGHDWLAEIQSALARRP